MKMYVKPATDVATINRATSVSASLAPEVIVQICLAVATEWDVLSAFDKMWAGKISWLMFFTG